ncbi:MAG: M50 family metallopeptidase [Candidatus Saccharibacteria bacterium]|nr:M50 family metallopeptidase [Candidatus Saccharibacteria bacterium]
MNIVVGVIVGLLVLMLLVVLHEGGHFIMSRRNGVHVKEFGIGFPPRAIAWKYGEDGKWHRFRRKDWSDANASDPVFSKSDKSQFKGNSKKLIEPGLIFSINFLPIGGFCSMDGESDADTRKGTFGAASFWSKTKILFGGVLMNWLTAIVILSVLSITGMPVFLENQFHIEADTKVEAYPIQVKEVIEGSPAEKGAFKVDDYIYAAKASSDEKPTDITSSVDLTFFNNDHKAEEVEYYVCRDSDEIEGTVDYETSVVLGDCKRTILKTTLNDETKDYLLGISMRNTGATTYHSTWSAPINGIVLTGQLTGETFKGLGMMIGDLFKGVFKQFSSDETVRNEGKAELEAAGDSVTGPVGILGMLFPSFIELGPTHLAFLAAVISISLACMNVLPIPALDGGRWLLIGYFRLRKKKLDTETENRIVSRAFMVILALAVLITILDIMRLAR